MCADAVAVGVFITSACVPHVMNGSMLLVGDVYLAVHMIGISNGSAVSVAEVGVPQCGEFVATVSVLRPDVVIEVTPNRISLPSVPNALYDMMVGHCERYSSKDNDD
jgi:hypothetical protein